MIRTSTSFVGLVALLWMSLQAAVFAQERQLEVHASVIRSHQPAGPRYPRVSPPLEGAAVGVAVGVGRKVAPWTLIEGELLVGGTTRVEQSSAQAFSDRYTAESDEVLASVLVRCRPEENRFVSMVIGGGFAFSTVAARDRIRTEPFRPDRPPSRERDLQQDDTRLAITGGVDFSVPVHRQVSVVFPARWRWVHRRYDGFAEMLSVARRAYHLGSGVRVNFQTTGHPAAPCVAFSISITPRAGCGGTSRERPGPPRTPAHPRR